MQKQRLLSRMMKIKKAIPQLTREERLELSNFLWAELKKDGINVVLKKSDKTESEGKI